MGAVCLNSQQTYETKFRNKYQFITQIRDYNFGDIKIYRKKQPNYDYVMVLIKYIEPEKLQTLAREISQLHAAFLKQNQPMALRIFNFEIKEDSISNCTLSLVKIYVQYFNFSLYDLIQQHKTKGQSFSYEQLKLIAYACFVTHRQFNQITGKNININSKSIYISTEGQLKFLPLRAEEFYQHDKPLCQQLCKNRVQRQVNLEESRKYITKKVKKLFAEICLIDFSASEEKPKIEGLFQAIKKCSLIEKVVNAFGQTKVQALNTKSKADLLKTEDTNGKNSGITYKTQISSSQQSKKNVLKRQKQHSQNSINFHKKLNSGRYQQVESQSDYYDYSPKN